MVELNEQELSQTAGVNWWFEGAGVGVGVITGALCAAFPEASPVLSYGFRISGSLIANGLMSVGTAY